MSENHETTHNYKSHTKEYVIVFVVLTVLTILELMIPGLDTKHVYKASALVLLAVSKALAVAFFYMHLKEETKWLKFIAAVPISAGLFAAVLIAESMYR